METEAGRRGAGQEHPTPRAAWASRSPRRCRSRSPTRGSGYTRGSALNHVCAHQTVIGQEAIRQMELADTTRTSWSAARAAAATWPACRSRSCGEQLHGGPEVRLIAAEPAACPIADPGPDRLRLLRHRGLTPLTRMHTLGHKFVPPPVHAGGLRAHNIAPLVSRVVEEG